MIVQYPLSHVILHISDDYYIYYPILDFYIVSLSKLKKKISMFRLLNYLLKANEILYENLYEFFYNSKN